MTDIEIATSLVFWSCFGIIAYVYLAYPVVIWSLARLFGHVPRPPAVTDEDLPFLSLLIAAYNEEAVLEDRINNALALDYPRHRLEIVIASDGSTDRTADIVRKYDNQGVRLLDYSTRKGKSSILNRAFCEVKGDVVVLSDANTFMEPGAARNLARWFCDPAVGVVCGRLELRDPKTGRNVDGLYWKYENFLKVCEASLCASLGVNGAIYAIRRRLFSPIPENTLIDDMIIPLQCRLRTGFALVYDKHAKAHEETAPSITSEFRRRVRFGAGGFQTIGLLWPLLHPRHGWLAFTFLSHKVLRWIGPFALLGLALSNTILWEHPIYAWLLACQIVFYLVALLANFLPAKSRVSRLVKMTSLFTYMNVALLVGFYRWLQGNQKAAWRVTARTAEANIDMALKSS